MCILRKLDKPVFLTEGEKTLNKYRFQVSVLLWINELKTKYKHIVLLLITVWHWIWSEQRTMLWEKLFLNFGNTRQYFHLWDFKNNYWVSVNWWGPDILKHGDCRSSDIDIDLSWSLGVAGKMSTLGECVVRCQALFPSCASPEIAFMVLEIEFASKCWVPTAAHTVRLVPGLELSHCRGQSLSIRDSHHCPLAVDLKSGKHDSRAAPTSVRQLLSGPGM